MNVCVFPERFYHFWMALSKSGLNPASHASPGAAMLDSCRVRSSLIQLHGSEFSSRLARAFSLLHILSSPPHSNYGDSSLFIGQQLLEEIVSRLPDCQLDFSTGRLAVRVLNPHIAVQKLAVVSQKKFSSIPIMHTNLSLQDGTRCIVCGVTADYSTFELFRVQGKTSTFGSTFGIVGT